MNIIGIKELQTNPGKLSRSMDNDEFILVTRRGVPLGITVPFTSSLVENGLAIWVAVKAFQSGDLSLGQLAKSIKKSKNDTIEFLNDLNIPLVDYNLDEDLTILEKIL